MIAYLWQLFRWWFFCDEAPWLHARAEWVDELDPPT